MYILTITNNFNSGYVAKKYETYEEAAKALNDYLKNEIQIVKTESRYEPSVLKWEEDDITLVYAPGYTEKEVKRNYEIEDCAYYRVFEVE